MIDYIEGILKIANIFLSLVAGYVAISLFNLTRKKKELYPWKILMIALIFFVIQEILGALRAFKIFDTSYLTHIVPTIIIGLLIFSLILQIILIKYKQVLR